MREIALFCEDYAHNEIIGAIVRRIAEEFASAPELVFRSSAHGHSMVLENLAQFGDEVRQLGNSSPDLIVVATDSNCRGNTRRKEVERIEMPVQVVHAIPDPHIERWLLLDSHAFKQVFGRGCNAPSKKCGRDLYKKLLGDAIHEAEAESIYAGLEFARDIIRLLDIDRVATLDKSFGRFVGDLRAAFRLIGGQRQDNAWCRLED